MSEKKSSEIIGELFQGFQHNDMVLYIGTGKWDQLSPEILNRPWRCVVTSRKGSTIGSDLGTDISVPVSVNSLEDINRIRFSSKQTAFVELFANQDDVNEEDIDFWEDTQTELAGEKLSALIKKLDVRANLIVSNYNPTDSNEISKAKFFNACDKDSDNDYTNTFKNIINSTKFKQLYLKAMNSTHIKNFVQDFNLEQQRKIFMKQEFCILCRTVLS